MKKVTAKAWIGHDSYIKSKSPSVSQMIFDTKREAVEAGWENPSRVLVTLIRKKPKSAAQGGE